MPCAPLNERSAGRLTPSSSDDDSVLRDFEPEDQQAVRGLVLAGMRERWGDAFDPSRNRDVDDVQANYLERGGDVIVIETAGEVVATGALLPEAGGAGRIVRVAVHRRYRRRGLARRLVKALVERARQHGMDTVLVATDTPWVSAVALYQSCGFDVVERTSTATALSMRLVAPAERPLMPGPTATPTTCDRTASAVRAAERRAGSARG